MKKFLIGLSLLFGAGLTVSQAAAANDYTNIKIAEKQNIQIELVAWACKLNRNDKGMEWMSTYSLVGKTLVIRPTDFVDNKWKTLITEGDSQIDLKMHLYTVPVLTAKYISKSSSIGPVNTVAYGKTTEIEIGECEEASHAGNITLSASINLVD